MGFMGGLSELIVTDVEFQAPRGELWLTFDRDCRTGSNVPDTIYARDIRGGHELYDINPRLAWLLWWLLAGSLAVFYARFQDEGKKLVLGITTPDETNGYGLVSSGGYLTQVLCSMLGDKDPYYEDGFHQMAIRKDEEHSGYHAAMAWIRAELPPHLQALFNRALRAETLHLGHTP